MCLSESNSQSKPWLNLYLTDVLIFEWIFWSNRFLVILRKLFMLSIAKFGDYTAQTPKKKFPLSDSPSQKIIRHGPSTNLIERDKVFIHNNSSVSGKPPVHVSFFSVLL